MAIPMVYHGGVYVTHAVDCACDHCERERHTRIWDAVVAAARGACLALAIGIGAAHAQAPPAQAQQAQVQPAPGDPAVEQIDADLRSLVASINARLSAINEDVIQLRERMKPHAQPAPATEPPPAPAPKPAPPQAK